MEMFEVPGMAQLGRRDELGGDELDRVQLAVQRAVPEIEEALQLGEARGHVVFLPDIGLEQGGMVGQVIEDLRGGQAVAVELGLAGSSCRPFWLVVSCVVWPCGMAALLRSAPLWRTQ